jgi:hypothetical protein
MGWRESARAGCGWWMFPAACALLFVLCAATYHGITDNYLFNDDFSWLSRARYDMTPSNIFTFRVVNFFRPAVNAAFFFFERLAPGNLRLNYAFNLMLHFICSVLVMRLFFSILGDWIAATAGGALFAVSSMHTGAVFWISARTTLMSTALLLGALLALTGKDRVTRRCAAISVVLYSLSLLSKETAIAGLPILLIIYILGRKEPERAGGLKTALVSWAAASAAYLALRNAVMGGFTLHDWAPGLHMLRNTAGGFLYQLRPWPLFSLFYRPGTRIEEPTNPFFPEILAIVALLFIWLLGRVSGRGKAFALGTLWALAALVPASAFKYRFYSTVSITQNRYYYLSSVGVTLLLVLVLSMLWSSRRIAARIACAAAVSIFIAGSIIRVDRLEKVWSGFTDMYEEAVGFIISTVEEEPGFDRVALEDPPLAFPYAADAISLYRPGWKVFEVEGGAGSAAEHSPCIYMLFRYEGDRVKRVDVSVMGGG